MFTYKNKVTSQNSYYKQSRKQNYGFYCGGSSTQSSNQSSNITRNSMFSSLHNELNNNINLINRETNVGNSMFRKPRGCGCRGGK